MASSFDPSDTLSVFFVPGQAALALAVDDGVPDTERCPVPDTLRCQVGVPDLEVAPAAPEDPPPVSRTRVPPPRHERAAAARAERRERHHELALAARLGDLRAVNALVDVYGARLLDAVRRTDAKGRPRDVPDAAGEVLEQLSFALRRGALEDVDPPVVGRTYQWLATLARGFARGALRADLGDGDDDRDRGDLCDLYDRFDDDRRWWPR